MKKVLIITYYWPPSGGSGVQRWLKMSKYLPESGWQPVIYTAGGAEYPVEDFSLEKEIHPETIVIRKPIVEPYNAYKRFLGLKKENPIRAGFLATENKPSYKEKIARWVRGNMFIPDARCWWIKPSVKFLVEYLRNNPVEAIISTGPPHSMHLIAMRVHRKTGIPWVADFRDPWTDIDFYGELRLTGWADRKHKRLEKEVLTQATEVVSIGWQMADGLERIAQRPIKVIPNGYDTDSNSSRSYTGVSEKFTITHIGIITPSRNNENLWESISELTKEKPSFSNKLEIKLIGATDTSVIKSLEKNGLIPFTTRIEHIDHDRVVTEQCSAQVLLLLINNTPNSKSILTGKIYEYLYAGRPILAIGPVDGDAAKILEDSGAGRTVEFDDKSEMKAELVRLFHSYEQGLLVSTESKNISRYSRKSQAGEYSILLENCIKQ